MINSEADPKKKKREKAKLKEDLKSLNKLLNKVDKTLYRKEQYSRKNFRLVHEGKEESNKDSA